MSSDLDSQRRAGVVLDSFASEWLGLPVYRLSGAQQADQARATLAGSGRYMLEIKIDATEATALGDLLGRGFALIDTAVQLDAAAALLASAGGAAGVRVRAAKPADRTAVERLSHDNMTTSRYHRDPLIDAARASRFKAAWAGNFFDGGRGSALFVAETAHGPGGFLQVIENGDQGVIDLIGVDPELRGTGSVGLLIAEWLRCSPHLARIVVGTQLSNVRSLRAYGKLGFRVFGAQYLLHYHAQAPRP